jgi:TolB-like protein
MLTGQLPFKGDYEQAIAYQITNVVPEPVTGLRSGIPLELERVVNKCLEKNPDERYQTASDLSADLKHIQRTISQSITPTAQLKQIPVRNKKYWYLMAGAVITVLVAVGIYFFIFLTQPSSVNKRTIAVLPFTNLSGNQEDEYFTDGIMEDILTQLSKIGELNVISRTTMMQYKGMKKSLRDIGNEVHAGVVLEGSARRFGNRIRISSQLIDAETDKHLWAETYDRDMQDVFAIQSDVAKQIAAALRVKLAPKEKELIEKKPTENMEAYNYYLKGREYYSRFKKQDNENAIELFKKAIAIDPNYALAWAGLADAYSQRAPRYGFPFMWLDSALTVSKKAIELDNSSAEAYKALGLVYIFKGYYDSSISANLRAVELNPNYWPAIGNIGYNYYTLGELCQSLRWYNRAVHGAPMLPLSYASTGNIYRLVGEYGKAEQYLRKASDLQFDESDTYQRESMLYLSMGRNREAADLINTLSASISDNPRFHEWAGYVTSMMGDLTKAKEYYQRSLSLRASNETINDSSGGTMLAYIFIKEGKPGQAEKILTKEMILAKEDIKRGVQGGRPEYTFAVIYAMRGEKKDAFTYLEKAIERGQRDYQMAVRDPRFENIRNDEEFKKLIAQMKAKCDEQKKLIEQMEKEESQ